MPTHYLINKKLVKRYPFLQRTTWWIEGLFFRVTLGLVRLLPPRQCIGLMGWLFGLIGPHTQKATKVRKNLPFVVPGIQGRELRQTVKAIFANLGRAAGELLAMDKIWRERDKYLEFVADPVMDEIIAGKPAVFVSAHVSAWQVTCLVGAQYGIPISTVYAEETNPHLAKLFAHLRSAFRTRLVPAEGGIRKLLKELQEGHSVGLVVDTRLDAGELVPFFGVPTPTNTVVPRMALNSGCKLVPVRAERLPHGRFRITICPPIEVKDDSLSRGEKALAMATELNLVFEQWIREDPTQWMCLKRRWPKRASTS